EINGASDLALRAKEGRTRLAGAEFQSQGVEGEANPEAVLYCQEALVSFATKEREEIQKVAFEIASLAMTGVDLNDPTPKYELASRPGKAFCGLQLVCWQYVGFQKLKPGADMGIDLSREYRAALSSLSDTDGA
ncbi:MAG: hypothetical protein AAF492_24600, partial [Verrucomicrobiota bacterium]